MYSWFCFVFPLSLSLAPACHLGINNPNCTQTSRVLVYIEQEIHNSTLQSKIDRVPLKGRKLLLVGVPFFGAHSELKGQFCGYGRWMSTGLLLE